MPLSVSGFTPLEGEDAGEELEVERSNILIVDDLPEKLLVFHTVLEDLGQNLVFVRSGSEALREVLAREFAVILLDVNMPDIDGFETAALIRRYKRSAHTPIIFITSYADEIQTVRGYALGAVDFILSPVLPDVLRTKVRVFVDLYTMRQRVRRQADERAARMAAEAARRVAEQNDRRSHFLSHASRVLSASLDVAIGERQLLELLVPQVAPFALLLRADEDQALDVGAVAAWAPEVQELGAARTRARALPETVRAALQRAFDSGRRSELSAASLEGLSGASFGVPGPAALRAAAAVPLHSGQRPIGVLLVAAEEAPPLPPQRDWSVLEDLAGRAAIAFENAQLYRSLQAEIFERRTAETELQEANRRKDEFLAMLSHELRNPLAPIRNAVELIRRIAPPEPKLHWAGEVMDRQVGHLTRLVEELLDVARISQGKIALSKQPVELKAVIAHSVETAQPYIDQRRHTLRVRVPGGPVWLHGDFARLAQVIGNLLNNAAKFSAEGGHIELELGVEDGQATIVVRDRGIGIDATLLPHIFDLFSQGTRSLDRSQGGLGVGLTLVRRLVELHGGRIEAHSAGVDQGSEFRVWIPAISVVRDDEPAAAAAPAPARGRRVLIVDDNVDAADSVAQYLQLEGHEVKTANDGQQALASVSVFAPQVVLLDIGLPLLDGYEVARRLRQMPAMREALLVAVTGYGQKEDRARTDEAGFDHHFVKPTDPQLIAALIADWEPGKGAGAKPDGRPHLQRS